MADLPAHDDWLTEPEAERLRSMRYTKRREEARLGRWTAKRALARTLRMDETDHEVLRDLGIRNAADGAPEVWFRGDRAPVSISMTDRADWAVCTVIGGERAIGCDLELVEPRTRAFVADYFTVAEQELVWSSDDADLLANLIWSAKESVLKVLRTGLRRDTRTVEVQPGLVELDDGWCGAHATTTDGMAFTGWWRRYGTFVLTYMSSRSTPPPASLSEPPPLAAAEPAHTWTDNPLRDR